MKPIDILKEYFGYDAFRKEQDKIIDSIISGQDTLAILPTGGGKSICYQIPAIYLHGTCIVISPLIALMRDQILQLEKRKIQARAIHSGLSAEEISSILIQCSESWVKLLYISPERLQSEIFLQALEHIEVSFLAIDEAHCISQWGYDFRPSYRKIKKMRDLYPHLPILALTASATDQVQQDICKELKFDRPQIFKSSFARPNIAFTVKHHPIPLQGVLDDLSKSYKNDSIIIYGNSRKVCVDTAVSLSKRGFKATFYHAGLSNQERYKRQQEWLCNQTPIMVCTNAFGMGIDKPDVKKVYHIHTPDCLENYYQEAGRAGRNGKYAEAILFYNDKMLFALQQKPYINYPDEDTIKNVYEALMDYLKIAIGTGENTIHSFDTQRFVQLFRLPALTTHYALKNLEAQEFIQLSDSIFRPSTFKFDVDIDTLRHFISKHHNSTAMLIEYLIRHYHDILRISVKVKEVYLAEALSVSVEEIENILSLLHENQLGFYKKSNNAPCVTILLNRTHAKHLNFSSSLQQMLKQQWILRSEKMIHYASDAYTCRSKLIAQYFGDMDTQDCGICDNCKNKHLTHKEMYILIQQYLKTPCTISELVIKTDLSKNNILSIISSLEKDNLLVRLDDGKFFLK